jgi:hypothetical protein
LIMRDTLYFFNNSTCGTIRFQNIFLIRNCRAYSKTK